MDIHNNYFIIYYGLNEIYVYEIQNYIDLVYKMRLPFYEQYSGFMFNNLQMYPVSNHHLRKDGVVIINSTIHNDYFDRYLAILMINPDYNGTLSMKIFVYSLIDFQHNSLVMTKDVTGFFNQTLTKQLVLTGSQLKQSMVLIADQKISLLNVEFSNQLKLRDDQVFRKYLIQKCSFLKYYSLPFGQKFPIEIATITIKANSLFDQKSTIPYQNNKVKLRIYSQNQGIAITPTQGFNRERNLYFSYGDKVNDDMTLSLENMLEGYNMSFNVNCTYFDQEGGIKSCLENGVQQYTNSLNYNFYIEFVTQIRQVIKSFTLNNIFLMFDTLNMITIQTLWNNDINLDNINGLALDLKQSYFQSDILGCNVEGYINVYECLWLNDIQPYTLYLMIYECKVQQTLLLNMALIKIFDGIYQPNITRLQYSQKIPYKIIDIERSNVTVVDGSPSKIRTTIAITVDNPQSTSNILLVQNLTIDIENSYIDYNILQISSANTLDKNAFKVNQLLRIPNSDLVVIVDQLFGVYIYDLDFLMILKELDLKKDNDFQDQSQRNMGDLQVFTVAGNWPYQFHVLTNYGVFIYDFQVDLTDRNQIFPFFESTLEPYQRRVIRYQFDTLNHELASNQYGYAFLMTKQTSKTTFDLYLGVISFFAQQESRVFKVMKVASNQVCLSLNEESSLIGDSQDELIVSFICNTQLYIVKSCLKPRLVINMKSYLGDATKSKHGRNVPGALQYNQFNLTITSTNEYIQEGLNQGQVTVLLHQKTDPDSKYPQFYLICSFVLCTVITLVMLLAVGGKKVSQEQDRKVAFDDAQLPKISMSFSDQRTSTLANHSSFIPQGGFKLLNLQNLNNGMTSTKQKNRETSFFDAPLITNSEADVMIEKAEKPVYNSVFTGVITNNQFLSTSKPEASAKFEILSSEVTPKSKPLHIKIPTTPKQDSGSSKQIGSPKFRQSPQHIKLT